MTDPATLLALAASVEAGEGRDMKMDVRIASALGLTFRWMSDVEPIYVQGIALNPDDRPLCPPYTASVDAALALLQEVLPGWRIRTNGLGRRKEFEVAVELMSEHGWQIAKAHGEAPTLPRAIVAAVLRAVAV